MSCRPELVTGWVDDALDAETRAEVAAHVEGCEACAEQARGEAELRRRLRSLQPVELPAGVAQDLRRRLRSSPWGWLRWAGPLAAGLVLVGLWAGGAPRVVAWELALDHGHCFGKERLPAQVWTTDADRVSAWLEAEGTPAPILPETADGLALLGARRCPLVDRRVGHVYYADDDRTLSLYVVPRGVRFQGSWDQQVRGHHVRLLRVGGNVVGLVSRDADALAAAERALRTTVAVRVAALP